MYNHLIMEQRFGRDAALRAVLSYAAAIAIIVWLFRGIRLDDLRLGLMKADLHLFIPAALGGFLCWFIGENLLFSRLFSCFHAKTSFREMLPISAVFYFVQLLNGGVAAGFLIWLMHRRKGVPWVEGGMAM